MRLFHCYRAVDTEAFLQAAVFKGFSRLVVQRGNGPYKPTLLPAGAFKSLTIE
jgi:hypothetical protein